MNRRSFFALNSLSLFQLFAGCRQDKPHSGSEHRIERLNLSCEELQKKIACSPAAPEKIKAVLCGISETLDLVKKEKLPDNFPNWIAFHAALMYPDSYVDFREGRNTDDNVKRIFATLQNSDTGKSGPFVIRSGSPFPRHSGPYFMQEHHPDQFLHYFSMAGGTLDAPLTVDGKKFTFQNVFDRSLFEVRTENELAYTVMLYAKFLEPGKRWKNKFGEMMSLAVLLEKLLKTPEKTCLGTHRFGALARVYARKELRNDKDAEKLWVELERQVFEALVRLKQSQRQDGGFEPTGLTSGTQTQENIDVYYTGHSLEWVMFLGKNHFCSDWIIRGVGRLCESVKTICTGVFRNLDAVGNKESYFDFDGLCHAVSALNRWKNSLESVIDIFLKK